MSGSASHSGENVPPHATSPHLRIHAVNVFVRDQEKSLRFYLDQLGFELAFDARLQSGERWVAVSPPDGTAVLTLVAPDPESDEYKLIGRPTSVVFVTEDVPAKYREWSRRGVRFRHTPRLRRVKFERAAPGSALAAARDASSEPVWGAVFTRFEDIDRNSFALVSFDEVTRELDIRRRAIAERIEAQRRAAQELEIAKRVQARLFPQSLPSISSLDYSGVCIQAREIGGDYYDFLHLGPARLVLLIGDVSGKGIAAALLMANLQAILRSHTAVTAGQPGELLRSVNHFFCQNTAEGSFATLFVGDYDDSARRLRYANCGHLPALVLHADSSVDRLSSTATVLGLFDDWECAIEEHQLAPGDTFLLYTDGVTESFNPEGEEFGEQRLIESLERHRALPPRDLLAAIVDDVQRFSAHSQRDDITLIAARCRS